MNSLNSEANGNPFASPAVARGLRPVRFTCKDCGKQFYKKWNYDCHRRVHTGDKPYQCNICGRGFAQRGGAKAHMLVHLNR